MVDVSGTEARSGVPCSGGGDVRATIIESKTVLDMPETLNLFKIAPRGKQMAPKSGEWVLSPNGTIFVAKYGHLAGLKV